MEKMNFKIATPERVVFKEDVDSVTLPTRSGEITILVNHTPLISVLKPGEIRIQNNGKETILAVSGGFIEVLSTKVVVLADTAERSEEIDVARAEAAIRRAEALCDERAADSREFAALTAQIEKELVRVKVGRKMAHRIEMQGAERPQLKRE